LFLMPRTPERQERDLLGLVVGEVRFLQPAEEVAVFIASADVTLIEPPDLANEVLAEAEEGEAMEPHEGVSVVQEGEQALDVLRPRARLVATDDHDLRVRVRAQDALVHEPRERRRVVARNPRCLPRLKPAARFVHQRGAMRRDENAEGHATKASAWCASERLSNRDR